MLCQIIDAQPVLNQSYLPNPGDTINYSHSSILPGSDDYKLTGEDYVWDFSTFNPLFQRTEDFLSQAESEYQQNWCFLNGIFFGCEDSFALFANLATPINFPINIDQVPVTNIINHLEKTEGAYVIKMLGITLDDGFNLIMPINYTVPDTIYPFPLTFGNSGVFNSNLVLDLNPFGIELIWDSDQVRSVQADGFGTLITPYGEFENVLRVKTNIIRTDIIDFNEPFTIVSEQNIYEWISTEFSTPLMRVNAPVINGQELNPDISYIDSIRCLRPIALANASSNEVLMLPENISETVTFSNNSIGADEYHWTFDDGTVSADRSPSHFWSGPGTYDVRMVACNTISCDPPECDTQLMQINVLDSLLGVFNTGDVYESGSILVFPNPTTTRLSIDLTSTDYCDLDYIMITDAIGQAQLLKVGVHQLKDLDVSHLSPGFYSLRVVCHNGANRVAHFIKKE